MVATYQDVVVEQNVTFEYVVDLLDASTGEPRTDLAGWTGTMVIRDERSPAGEILGTATVTVDNDNAQAIATIADTVTATYEWSAGWYDLRITNGTISERVAEGRATLSPNVT